MKSPLPFAILAILPSLMFSACCSNTQPRFWKVRDGKGGATAYTVDTPAVPARRLGQKDIRYVDSAGHYVEMRNPRVVSQISEQEWKQATSGADYSLWYCGHCKGCWAKAKEKK